MLKSEVHLLMAFGPALEKTGLDFFVYTESHSHYGFNNAEPGKFILQNTLTQSPFTFNLKAVMLGE